MYPSVPTSAKAYQNANQSDTRLCFCFLAKQAQGNAPPNHAWSPNSTDQVYTIAADEELKWDRRRGDQQSDPEQPAARGEDQLRIYVELCVEPRDYPANHAPQVVEESGGPVETRTPDLYRVKVTFQSLGWPLPWAYGFRAAIVFL